MQYICLWGQLQGGSCGVPVGGITHNRSGTADGGRFENDGAPGGPLRLQSNLLRRLEGQGHPLRLLLLQEGARVSPHLESSIPGCL